MIFILFPWKNGYLVDIDIIDRLHIPQGMAHHDPPQQHRSKRRGHKSGGAYIGFVPLQPRISPKKNRFLRYVKDVTWMEKTYMNIILKKHMKTWSSPVLVDFRWILDGCWWTLKEKKMAVVLADRQESPHLKDGLVHRYGVQLPQGVLSCSPSRQDSGGKLRKTGWKLDEDWLIPIFFFGNLRLCSNMSTTNHTSIKAISCFVLLRRWSCWFEEMSIWIHYPSLAVTSNFKQD